MRPTNLLESIQLINAAMTWTLEIQYKKCLLHWSYRTSSYPLALLYIEWKKFKSEYRRTPVSITFTGGMFELRYTETYAITSQDRPKLAPYLRLKISKRTPTCQSILFYSTRKKTWKKSRNAEKNERGTLWDVSTSILSQNSKKNWWRTLLRIFSRKMSHRAEKRATENSTQ